MCGPEFRSQVNDVIEVRKRLDNLPANMFELWGSTAVTFTIVTEEKPNKS